MNAQTAGRKIVQNIPALRVLSELVESTQPKDASDNAAWKLFNQRRAAIIAIAHTCGALRLVDGIWGASNAMHQNSPQSPAAIVADALEGLTLEHSD